MKELKPLKGYDDITLEQRHAQIFRTRLMINIVTEHAQYTSNLQLFLILMCIAMK